MPGNRGVAYMGPGKVEVADLDYPEFILKDGRLMWSSSRPVTCAQCLSILPVVVAGTVRKARLGFV
jgi:hypothetical protein